MPKKHIPRPDHAFIGNHTYAILWLTQEEWDERHLPDDADASTYATAGTIAIQIRGGAAESHYQEIMWHEITHACWDATMLTHIDFEKHPGGMDLEEFIISAQTPSQFFAMRQNPALMEWMLLADPTEVRGW